MSIKDEHRALIDSYLSNTLSESDKADLVRLLEEHPELEELVLEEKRIVTALQASEKAQLKKHLKTVANNTPQKSSGFFPAWWLAAASATLIVSIGYFFYLNNSSLEITFNEYYEPYPAISVQRGQITDINSALKLYSQGKYKEAIEAFGDLTLSDNPTYYLYLGNCYLQTKDPNKAIEIFKTVNRESNDTILKQNAQWYLALAYLKKEDLQQTRKILKEIIQNEGIYAEHAEKLLGKLD
ncbi:hypothetical protein C900_05760 [Fulvivirga imtechensis AK7]|uniref:Tetratricopeptide repeat protein n=1 Tax=Fulvivirga imtechensis AK7 TaxID=1237149 RepID=L8JWG2_9BACT|nr:tetratricopeptide repeat protein [Fulvivirga imtechensis]ELR73125.1 hypothetical protein C900_05760 [Fulvivirga imtechensis AK7]